LTSTGDLAALAARRAPRPPAGLVLARRSGDGRIEVASAGPVDPGAVFELGSITKVATGLLLADAVVRCKVALDTPLGECVPVAGQGAEIRLGDLARHRSGLPRLPLAFLRRVGFFDLTDPYEGSTVDELLADLERVRLRRPRFRYSNFGVALLGQALAARAGRPYEELVQERVLGQLELGEVWAHGAPPVAQPHTRRGRPVPPWTLGAYAPAGCLRGTARGALALSVACLDPPAPMAEAVALALEPSGRRGAVDIGLGWLLSPAGRDHRMWWQNGGTHGSRAFTGFDPERRIAVAAVTNSSRSPDSAAREAVS
jgi:CubicO group peptidase (beta-lactamase class C family)